MKIIDRYIAAHFVGPFFVGVGAFTAILLGVSEISYAVSLVVRDGVPVSLAVKYFFLHVPMVVALTMPMATVFAALMAAGALSNHGELVAMRAGGVSLVRMSITVMVCGLIVAVATFAFDEALSPLCNSTAGNMLQDFLSKQKKIEKPISYFLPEEGTPERAIIVLKLNPEKRELLGITINEFRNGKLSQVFSAERAVWVGTQWKLVNVVHRQYTGKGYRESRLREVMCDIGRTPDDIGRRSERRPEEYTLAELKAEVAKLMPDAKPGSRELKRALWLTQHYHIRIATPWAALCFAVLGFPLGMRPQRATTGIGFGISLALVFVYYIIFNFLQAFGQQGAMSPVLAAWLPNIVLLGAGLGLLIDASR
jgi:lipopolysaccharide export system permease protein